MILALFSLHMRRNCYLWISDSNSYRRSIGRCRFSNSRELIFTVRVSASAVYAIVGCRCLSKRLNVGTRKEHRMIALVLWCQRFVKSRMELPAHPFFIYHRTLWLLSEGPLDGIGILRICSFYAGALTPVLLHQEPVIVWDSGNWIDDSFIHVIDGRANNFECFPYPVQALTK